MPAAAVKAGCASCFFRPGTWNRDYLVVAPCPRPPGCAPPGRPRSFFALPVSSLIHAADTGPVAARMIVKFQSGPLWGRSLGTRLRFLHASYISLLESLIGPRCAGPGAPPSRPALETGPDHQPAIRLLRGHWERPADRSALTIAMRRFCSLSDQFRPQRLAARPRHAGLSPSGFPRPRCLARNFEWPNTSPASFSSKEQERA